jgi:hypothetical protein
MNKQEFEIESLGIRYALERKEEGNFISMTEDDFEKIFDKIRELQSQVATLQDQMIEDLKKIALIKNILNS